MSRFMEFSACCKNKCAWKCCGTNEDNTINLMKFGRNVRTQMKTLTPLYLISERGVHLNEKNQIILKIGCSPQHFFEVIARFESPMKNSVVLTSEEVSNLMEFLDTNFNENEIWKSPYELNEYQLMTPSMKYVIELKPAELRTFSLRIGRKYLTIDEESLMSLLRKKNFIEHYMLVLGTSRRMYESRFFNLTSHFCYENKTLKDATDLSRSKYYVHHFFDEILNFHWDCIDKTFAIEIGANLSEWFSKCVPIFIKTIMLNEVDRLKSFSSSGWPHDKKYINVKNLAKSGLFYTGERDVVGCAFCNVQLHDWKFDDNAVLDHHKYSPKCSFLIDPKTSPNVAIGDEKKIAQLLSVLPKVHDYDVADY